MPIANSYKVAVQNIINRLNTEVTSTKPRRHLSTLFLELPDPSTYADYYSIITEPRSINGVQEKLQKNRYRNILDVLNDLYLVFANALHYNEASSQIYKDAAVLKELFEQLWKDDPYLPNAQPTKQPGRKPGFRAIPLPRMSSFALPQRAGSSSFQPSYSMALATVQLKPVGKPPAPIVAPRLQPLRPRKMHRKKPAKTETTEQKPTEPTPATTRRAHSPAFSEVDFQANLDGEDSEPDIPQTHIANEAGSVAIIKRLDDSLPRWEPWGDGEGAVDSNLGWMPELEGEALQARLEDFVARMRSFLDPAQQRPLTALEEVATRPDPYSSFEDFIAWASITTRISQKQYSSCRKFETDLFRLFEKARRFYPPTSPNYGSVLVCQWLANVLTSLHATLSPNEQVPMPSVPGPRRAQHYQKVVDGSVVENPAGTLSYDVLPKRREHAERVIFKGIEYKIGDFVHLTNPEDVSRPMIGQIWACWTSSNTQSFTVCWYFRPEQTSHRANHPFYENEVVKTGLYVDYMPQDIIERVCIQFHPHYFTGRPRPPHWYPSWPIYVCEQRYDERNRTFHHITNPERCFPPSMRSSTEPSPPHSNSIMHAALFQNPKLDAIHPVYPFERLVFPLRKSGPNAGPRLPTSTGPTSFTIGPADAKDGFGGALNGGGFDMGRDGRGRPKRMAAVKAANAVGTPMPGSPGGAILAPGGSMGIGGGNMPSPGDRTIVSAAGGGMITAASVDKLPPETTQIFDRDSISNEMLWFSGAPLDVARTPKPRYSLDYLYQMALKQKRKAGESIDEDGGPDAKRAKRVVLPTASEVWYDASLAANNGSSNP